MPKKFGLFLVGLGAFFVTAALLSRFFAYEQLAVVPLDQETTSVSYGPDATIFDLETQEEITVDLESVRTVVGDVEASEAASEELGEDIAIWETAVVNDENPTGVGEDNPPRSATYDRVAFDRHTGQTVKCCGTFTSTSADENGESIRNTISFDGLYFKFPFQTEKQDYQFWDGSLGEATEIEYKDTETIDGLTVYRFEQQIPPTDVGDINAPASFFGVDEEGDVTFDRIYSNTRTLWVEPETGVIIRGQEDQLAKASYQGEDVATLTDVVIGYNDETIADNVDTYSSLATQLKVLRLWAPIILGVLGVLMLLIGAVVIRRRSQHEAAA